MTTATKYIMQTMQDEYNKKKDKDYDYKKIYFDKLVKFRHMDGSIIRIERPSNPIRARTVGYKAKQGYVIVFVKVRKGSGIMRRPTAARDPKRMGVNKLTRRISIQRMAEQKADRKFPGLEVLNSYYVGEDGQQKYFEVIMVDPNHPSIVNDKNINWICSEKHKGRAFRGLTSAGRRNRGLIQKGTGNEKNGPSNRSNLRKAK